MPKKPSIQSIQLTKREQNFVGREAEIQGFRTNLDLPYEQRKYIWNIVGQGGIGKSTLLKRYLALGRDYSAQTALTDESQTGIIEVMSFISSQFQRQQWSLSEFDTTYEKLIQLHGDIQRDPELPKGLAETGARLLGKIGVSAVKQVPGLGIGVDLIGEETLLERLGELGAFLSRKLGNHEMKLVMDPVNSLSPILLKGLNEIAKESKIVLGFDTYEKTRIFLEPWLQSLFEGKYGEMDPDIFVIIAGRERLGSNWSDYIGISHVVTLKELSEREAREFLLSRSITEPAIVEIILKLSGRIPLWLATLASQSPKEDAVGDPTDEAIERFLKWVDDESHHRAALVCAVPRYLNLDVVNAALGDAVGQQTFDWLKTQPFVEKKAGAGWTYHEIVRSMMLRHLRANSTKEWVRLNTVLAAYYSNLDRETSSRTNADASDWKHAELGGLYHKLLADGDKSVPLILETFVGSFRWNYELAKDIGDCALDAGTILDSPVIVEWGQRIGKVSENFSIGNPDKTSAIDLFRRLEGTLSATSPHYVEFLSTRAFVSSLFGEQVSALDDLNNAIKLQPDNAKLFDERGRVLRALGRAKEALSDLEEAIRLQPLEAEHLSLKADILSGLNLPNDALDAYTSAIELAPKNPWHLSSRALVLKQLGQDERALQDLSAAITLSPAHFRYGQRASLFRQMGRFEEAIEDYNRAIELRDERKEEESFGTPGWRPRVGDRVIVIGSSRYEGGRAQIYHALGRFEEALADYSIAVADSKRQRSDEQLEQANYLYLRNFLYRDLDNKAEADADCERAIAIVSRLIENREVLSESLEARSLLLTYAGRFEEALVDLTNLIARDPLNADLHLSRGNVCRSLNQFPDALNDFNKALELMPRAWSFVLRARLLEKMDRCEEALNDYAQAIALRPDAHFFYAYRANLLDTMGQKYRALADYNIAIAIRDSKPVVRGNTMANIDDGRYIGPTDYEVLRFQLNLLKGNYDQAGADLRCAIAVLPSVRAGLLARLGFVLACLGEDQKAKEQHLESLKQNPSECLALYGLLSVNSRLNGIESIKDELSKTRRTLESLLESESRDDPLFALAGLEALEGNDEKAFDLLRQAAEIDKEFAVLAQHEPGWAIVRRHPTFRKLLHELIGDKDASDEAGNVTQPTN